MDINRFTEKAQSALRDAQGLAVRLGHQQIDVEHVLMALLDQERGLAPAILNKADVSPEALKIRVQRELERDEVTVLRLLHGQPVVLQLWPGSWPTEIQSDPNGKFGLRQVALEQQDWVAMLAIGQIGFDRQRSRLMAKGKEPPNYGEQ